MNTTVSNKALIAQTVPVYLAAVVIAQNEAGPDPTLELSTAQGPTKEAKVANQRRVKTVLARRES